MDFVIGCLEGEHQVFGRRIETRAKSDGELFMVAAAGASAEDGQVRAPVLLANCLLLGQAVARQLSTAPAILARTGYHISRRVKGAVRPASWTPSRRVRELSAAARPSSRRPTGGSVGRLSTPTSVLAPPGPGPQACWCQECFEQLTAGEPGTLRRSQPVGSAVGG